MLLALLVHLVFFSQTIYADEGTYGKLTVYAWRQTGTTRRDKNHLVLAVINTSRD